MVRMEHATVDSCTRLHTTRADVCSNIPNLATLVISRSIDPLSLLVIADLVNRCLVCFGIGVLVISFSSRGRLPSGPGDLSLFHIL